MKRKKNTNMKPLSQAISIALGALALGAAVAAQAATLMITDIAMVPRLTIQSDLGITNQIQYTNNLGQSDWTVLTNVVVTQSPYYFVDVTAPPAPQRFYRVVVPEVTPPTQPSGMVLIPAGSFTMGNSMDPAEGASKELPLHTNYVSAFYMDTNLVTYTLWTTVYDWAVTNGYSFTYAGAGKEPNHPVHTVSWYDMLKWCNARSEMEGRTPCYYTNASQSQMEIYRSGDFDLTNGLVNWAASGYRLPTEAEWEKAARGGASGHRFPWSDVDTITFDRANYYSDTNLVYDLNTEPGFHPIYGYGAGPYTSPVGSFAPNGYGLYDMAGNLFQWCWDWSYGNYYAQGDKTDPHGPDEGAYRVLRGGCWAQDYTAYYCRVALREGSRPYQPGDIIGFRCVVPTGQ